MRASRDELLDLVRGLSAVAVLVAHVRAFLFKDFGALSGPGLVEKVFYFGTGIHHQAVMVFFVLSGYFVGGAVCSQVGRNTFSTKRYAVARLSRLWTVLLPALVLTAVCDGIGRTLAPAAYEGGLRAVFMSGPTLEVPADLSVRAFFGNLAFLQTVEVPVFGSNGPLWSLANEFWYYVIFPLLALAATGLRKSPLKAIGCAILVAGITWWLPRLLVFQGGIWLLGVAVWWLKAPGPAWWRIPVRVMTSLALFGTLAMSKTTSPLGSDYAVGLGFAGWLWVWKGVPLRGALIRRLATGLSDISYTLYVSHFPILFLVAAVGFRGQQMEPGWLAYAWFTGLTLALLGIARLMWFAFERRTDEVRRWVGGRING
jgi:peptidoglycan/LPS O-acetylase OafA/YrhL